MKKLHFILFTLLFSISMNVFSQNTIISSIGNISNGGYHAKSYVGQFLNSLVSSDMYHLKQGTAYYDNMQSQEVLYIDSVKLTDQDFLVYQDSNKNEITVEFYNLNKVDELVLTDIKGKIRQRKSVSVKNKLNTSGTNIFFLSMLKKGKLLKTIKLKNKY